MALLAILAGLAASTPTAADAFRTFEALCISTAAQPAAALAQADKQGWVKIPPEGLARLPSRSGQAGKLQGRAVRVGDWMQVLTVEPVPAGRFFPVRNNCQLNVEGVSYAALLPVAAKWAGVPPLEQQDKGAMFVFSDASGRHQAISHAELNKTSPQVASAKRITQFNVLNLSRGAALQVIIPVR